jgi:uncharacterized peroxidase-related enzyme
MNRLHQTDPAQATGKTRQLFDKVEELRGFVPNVMRVFGNSPAALEAYLDFSGALMNGALPVKLREQIALAVSEINGCGYCLSASTLSGAKAGLSSEEITAARRGVASDGKSNTALKLARAVALERGHISDGELQAARRGGLNDAEIVEVIQHVALTTLTNYTNNAARTALDFPEVKPGEFEFARPAAA